MAYERVLLVGFMGAGKTVVGQSLAKRLGWAFADFDHEIEGRVGLPIHAIFRQHGEKTFRRVENEVAKDLLGGNRVVLASGGGWPARAGRMESLAGSTFSVWLQVSPAEAMRRVGAQGSTRPLLEVPDPLEVAQALLAEREPFYKKARIAIDSMTAEPEELALQIEMAMKEKGRNYLRSLPPHE